MKLCASITCCLDEEEVAKVIDRVAVALLMASRSRIKDLVTRDVEASRNALTKVLGGVRALRNRVKNIRSLAEIDDIETVVNTFVNTLNRLVEVRNLLQRMKEVAEDSNEGDVATMLGEAMAFVSGLTIAISAVALHSIHELKKLSKDDCGKLASAIGTAIFAALLDAETEVVRDALSKCFPATYHRRS